MHEWSKEVAQASNNTEFSAVHMAAKVVSRWPSGEYSIAKEQVVKQKIVIVLFEL